MKTRICGWLLVLMVMVCLAVQLQAANITSILANATRASTVYSSDVSIKKYMGTGRFYLTADAQGSGVTSTLKLQQSSAPVVGYGQTTAGDTDLALRSVSGTDTMLSVQFTQSGNRQVKSVQVRLKQVGTITSGNLTAEIQTDAAGLPSGAVSATAGTVLASSIAAGYEWVTFTFATPVDLTATDIYHLVLSGTYAISASNYIAWSSLIVGSGGAAEVYGTSWTNVATKAPEAMVFQYQFSDVTGGAFAAVGNAASLQTLTLNTDSLENYVRVLDTVAGGSATGSAAVILIGKYKYGE